MQNERSQRLGSTLGIHLRNADGSAGEQLGLGRIIHPQLVQVLPPLDAEFFTKPRRSREFLLVAQEQDVDEPVTHQVLRIRPGLISHREAGDIIARELPDFQLDEPSTDRMVAFETAELMADDLYGMSSSSWWCRIVCLSSCATC